MANFSKNLHSLPLKPKDSAFDALNLSNEDGYYRLDTKKHVFLGKKGKVLFNKNENAFVPYNYYVFNQISRGLNLPTIMNFYDKEIHLMEKKKFEFLLNSKGLLGMFAIIEDDTRKLLIGTQTASKEMCLFDEITKYIIKVQSKYFFNYSPSAHTLSQLAYFEDYFTLGLYINPLEKLQEYFDYSLFVESKNIFIEIYDKIRHEKLFQSSINYRNNLDDCFLSEDRIYNHFYNFIAAGSANISKSFVYLICFINESDFAGEIMKKCNSINDFYSLAGKLINEFYRLIPFIENQVVGPYLYRICDRDFRINQIHDIKKGDEIYFYNTLENVDPDLFDDPFLFNPFRENLSIKGKSSSTFGAGVHRCSGAYLTDLWLHHLLVCYLKLGITLNSEKGLQHISYNPSFEEIKKVVYMVKPSKYEDL